ncbi:hypothetical protein L4X63_22800 [Geomonas sp. Red32]|uniref:hypothetical protein n=1 Tax=Geomonas sp. Red32 TaxID=2912856 RepID=UPI00202CAD69|nr:hypothetical protein [Geomonas sp. Red32]MCM0084411.1 hypothetical protein [Geomonas sp. Red32]
MRNLVAAVVVGISLLPSPARAWNDLTHMAVMEAAGLGDYSYLAAGPDMAKEKAGGHEDGNHYRDNPKGTVVTADMVLDQVRDYNCRCNGEGHLYGAIVAALHDYRQARDQGKYARYPRGYASHYIADLSMPLHNTTYDDFNRAHHAENDGVVERGVTGSTRGRVDRIAAEIRGRMKRLAPYRLPAARDGMARFDKELAARIAKLANRSMALGYRMEERAQAVMTSEEAYGQLAESALLLKEAYRALQ